MIGKTEVTDLAQERIDELDKGLFIVELTIQDNNFINILIDCKEGHVSVADCMSVSRNVEHNLDREVEDFQLSV
ncbi:MAG: ribosome maturation factor RimP, partial [Nonlabens sp.]